MAEDVLTDPERRARPRLVTPVFLLITISTFCYFVAIGALLPTLPRYVEGPLGGDNFSVGLVIGAFALSAVVLRPFVGRLGDEKGRRLLMIGGAGAVALSILTYSTVSTLWLLIVLRLVTGFGEAGFYVGAASAVNDLAPDERRGEALSFFSLALYSGLAVGPVLGETVLDGGHFTTAYLVAGAAAALAAAIALRVPDTRPDDLEPSTSGRILHRSALVPGAILATSVWGLSGFNTFVPLYALSIGMDGSRAVFVTFSITVLLVRSFGARLPDVLGVKRAGTAALISSAVGLTVIGAWTEPAGLFIGAVAFGLGQALAFPALMTLAVSGAPAAERGSVVGTFTAFFDLSFGLGAFTLGAVAELFGYRGLFFVSAGMALIGLSLLLGYARRVRATRNVVEARLAEHV